MELPKPKVERQETPPEEAKPDAIDDVKPARSKVKAAAVAPVESAASAASTAVDGSQYDEPPEPYIYNMKPPYPRDAKAQRLEGLVKVRLWISAEGLVSHAEVAQSSGIPSFDDSARRTALQWRFAPARYLGANVAVVFTVPVRFTHPDAT
ncbi:MAG: energy transducer TonB [Pirellulales bacterium]